MDDMENFKFYFTQNLKTYHFDRRNIRKENVCALTGDEDGTSDAVIFFFFFVSVLPLGLP